MNNRKYFELLEINLDATPEEAKQAYRDIVSVWHPDKYSHNPRLMEKAEEKMKQINEAYSIVIKAIRARDKYYGFEKDHQASSFQNSNEKKPDRNEKKSGRNEKTSGPVNNNRPAENNDLEIKKSSWMRTEDRLRNMSNGKGFGIKKGVDPNNKETRKNKTRKKEKGHTAKKQHQEDAPEKKAESWAGTEAKLKALARAKEKKLAQKAAKAEAKARAAELKGLEQAELRRLAFHNKEYLKNIGKFNLTVFMAVLIAADAVITGHWIASWILVAFLTGLTGWLGFTVLKTIQNSGTGFRRNIIAGIATGMNVVLLIYVVWNFDVLIVPIKSLGWAFVENLMLMEVPRTWIEAVR